MFNSLYDVQKCTCGIINHITVKHFNNARKEAYPTLFSCKCTIRSFFYSAPEINFFVLHGL